MNPVPVQIENCTLSEEKTSRPLAGVCGTCTKCGASQSVAIAEGRGGPVTKRREAVAEVLAKLTEGCEHPLPWGVSPDHVDRGIPRGVRLFAEETHASRRWPLSVNEKGKLLTAAGGCALTAKVLVVPDEAKYLGDAADFAKELKKRGYVNATTAAPESPQVKAEGTKAEAN